MDCAEGVAATLTGLASVPRGPFDLCFFNVTQEEYLTTPHRKGVHRRDRRVFFL